MYINTDDIDDELTTGDIETLTATNEVWTVSYERRTETNEVIDDNWAVSHYHLRIYRNEAPLNLIR